MGDVIVVAGKLPDGTLLPVGVSAEVTKDLDGEYVWSKGGEKRRFTSGRVNWFGRDPDWADKAGFRGKNDIDGKLGEWTRLECICNHDRITNICNGVIVNELFDVTPTAGKITIQSELAALESPMGTLADWFRADLTERKRSGQSTPQKACGANRLSCRWHPESGWLCD